MAEPALPATRAEVLALFSNLRVWTRGDERAPHKPLLLLYALARCARGEPREVPFAAVEQALTPLLREFGPARKTYHPEYPFWHLRSDHLWVLRDADDLPRRTGNTNVSKGTLLQYDVHGGLPPSIDAALRADPGLVREAARLLLAETFPESMHEDVAAAVGLDLEETTVTVRSRRDPAFRERVLRAYEYRCGMCGFSVRLGSAQVALDAAHIKWHQAGGPDVEPNGIALCVLHHKLFDRGGFTIGDDLRVLLSADLHGERGFEEHLLPFHGRTVAMTSDPLHRPAAEHLGWHRREVFHGPGRYVEAEG